MNFLQNKSGEGKRYPEYNYDHLSELSTFVTYCQTIFKTNVISGIIIGKNKHIMLAGSFNLLRLLPSNVVIVRTDVKTSSSIHLRNLLRLRP